MRIVFDMKGTLIDGRDRLKPKMGRILKAFHLKGHEIHLWSNMASYCSDFVRDHPEFEALVTGINSKRTHGDFREYGLQPYDIAFEDDRDQYYLGANQMVFVGDIPNITTDDEIDSYVTKLVASYIDSRVEGAD